MRSTHGGDRLPCFNNKGIPDDVSVSHLQCEADAANKNYPTSFLQGFFSGFRDLLRRFEFYVVVECYALAEPQLQSLHHRLLQCCTLHNDLLNGRLLSG